MSILKIAISSAKSSYKTLNHFAHKHKIYVVHVTVNGPFVGHTKL